MKVCYVKLEKLDYKFESVWTNHTQHTSGWVLQGLPCRMWSHPCRNSKAWKQLWSVSTNHLGSRYQILSSPMFKVQSNESTMSKHCSHNYFPQQACLVSRKWIEWSAMPHIQLKIGKPIRVSILHVAFVIVYWKSGGPASWLLCLENKKYLP